MKTYLIALLIGATAVSAQCVNDDTVSDRDGDTCSGYYDLDNSVCGVYDTETFTANDACCSCQMTSFEVSASQFTNDGAKCRGTPMESSEAEFEGTRKLMLWRQKQEEDACYQNCQVWDEALKYSYKNSDSMCCEYKMFNNGTAQCNFFYQGDNSRVLTQSVMDLAELGIEMTAQVFPHTQVLIKDMDVDDVLDEVDPWWSKLLLSATNAAAWSSVPMVFTFDQELSTNQLDYDLNWGLLINIYGLTWIPFLLSAVVFYFKTYPTENQLDAYNLIYNKLVEDSSDPLSETTVDVETLAKWSKLSIAGDNLWMYVTYLFLEVTVQSYFTYQQYVWTNEASTVSDGSVISYDTTIAQQNAQWLLISYTSVAAINSAVIFYLQSQQSKLNEEIAEYWPQEEN